MTIFAVMCALVFPGIHIGRPWLPYWMFPAAQPDGHVAAVPQPVDVGRLRGIDLRHGVGACSGTSGLIPDLATARDRAKTRVRQLVYGFFALGWRGSFRQWLHYEKAYLLLAGLATPLVLSVHSVVSFDFATSQLPGWHTTIFPPYFVAGAIFSGLAMVITLMVICAK